MEEGSAVSASEEEKGKVRELTISMRNLVKIAQLTKRSMYNFDKNQIKMIKSRLCIFLPPSSHLFRLRYESETGMWVGPSSLHPQVWYHTAPMKTSSLWDLMPAWDMTHSIWKEFLPSDRGYSISTSVPSNFQRRHKNKQNQPEFHRHRKALRDWCKADAKM